MKEKCKNCNKDKIALESRTDWGRYKTKYYCEKYELTKDNISAAEQMTG